MKLVEKEMVVEEPVKQTELCAIPKNFVEKKLQDLYEANKDVFNEYQMWMNVINSQVQVSNQEVPTKDITE